MRARGTPSIDKAEMARVAIGLITIAVILLAYVIGRVQQENYDLCKYENVCDGFWATTHYFSERENLTAP
jgi:hypothetical protein